MYEAVSGNTYLAKRIVRNYSDMMFAGVVAGNNSGRIWVDGLENPASALVWSEGLECFQFMGRSSNEIFNNGLKTFINTIIIRFLKEKNLKFFEYAADSEEWYPIINCALSDKEVKEDWQRVYRPGSKTLKDKEIIIPKPYYLYSIDERFFSAMKYDMKINNPEFLIKYIEQFWGSMEIYHKLGSGYLAVSGDEIVSFAIASALYEKTASIGVETLENHRRKGLASTLVKALLKELYEKDCNIWWDCMESNIGSQKTAESAGLIPDHKYKVCWFNFKKIRP
ncbi:MAG: GNAT family N-acetyltransferase [Clostridiaceae bacterium]